MPLRIAITGSNGLIGTAILNRFLKEGHTVTRIVRPYSPASLGGLSITWDSQNRQIDQEGLEGHDVIIHLAGANVAERRWSSQWKDQMCFSRIEGTEFLCTALSQLRNPPHTFFCASAVGYYGNHPEHVGIDEMDTQGQGFLADLCGQWERATEPVQRMGMGVIPMRFGLVLSKKGGALAKMLPIFQKGLGGVLGSGRQIMSWIALEEIPAIILYLLKNVSVTGPVNFVSPHPVSQAEFVRTLGEVLRKPTVLPVPGFILKLILGQMAEEMLLSGAQVVPRRVEEIGYQFAYPHLKSSLESILL